MGEHDWKFHCAVLCVPENASLKEIKDAFRKLALKYHPDRNGSTDQAKEKFQQINDSYHYLVRNIDHRPPLPETVHEVPATVPPTQHAPQPSHHRRTKLRDPEGASPDVRGLGKAVALIVEGYEFLHSPKMRPPLVAACFVLAALIAIKFILGESRKARRISDFKPPIVSQPHKKQDHPGRVVAVCEHLSRSQGTTVKRWSGEVSEFDCDLSCNQWFLANDTFDGFCLWNGKEFHQHAAVEQARNLAATTQPSEPVRHPTFVLDSEPEFDGPVPTMIRQIKLTDTQVFDFDFVGSIWIGDHRLMLGREGINPKQVVITPIRKGVTGVVFMDQNNVPWRKIIYEIQ